MRALQYDRLYASCIAWCQPGWQQSVGWRGVARLLLRPFLRARGGCQPVGCCLASAARGAVRQRPGGRRPAVWPTRARARQEADLKRLHEGAIRDDPFISRALGPKAKVERMKAAALRLGSQARRGTLP